MSRPPVFKRSISQHEVAQFIDSPDEVFVDEETHQRILNHPASNGENLRYACVRRWLVASSSSSIPCDVHRSYVVLNGLSFICLIVRARWRASIRLALSSTSHTRSPSATRFVDVSHPLWISTDDWHSHIALNVAPIRSHIWLSKMP